jgi:hypothetical protein
MVYSSPDLRSVNILTIRNCFLDINKLKLIQMAPMERVVYILQNEIHIYVTHVAQSEKVFQFQYFECHLKNEYGLILNH